MGEWKGESEGERIPTFSGFLHYDYNSFYSALCFPKVRRFIYLPLAYIFLSCWKKNGKAKLNELNFCLLGSFNFFSFFSPVPLNELNFCLLASFTFIVLSSLQRECDVFSEL